METWDEDAVRSGLERILGELVPGRFGCRERKSLGQSAIGKPVDLEIYLLEEPRRVAVAVEVANVNTTQLVNETTRLYFDSCPLKLLVLGGAHPPKTGRQQCEQVLARLYGQDSIANTPARVVKYDDDQAIEAALRDLLLL